MLSMLAPTSSSLRDSHRWDGTRGGVGGGVKKQRRKHAIICEASGWPSISRSLQNKRVVFPLPELSMVLVQEASGTDPNGPDISF